MPWGAAAGLAASVAGSAISSAMAPSTSGGSGGAGSYYVPSGLQGADQQWQNLQNQNYNVFSASQPQLQDYGQQSLAAQLAAYNTYGSPYQNAANLAGQQYGNLGQQLTNLGNQNIGYGQQLQGYGQQVFNTALDPQSALYNRSVQQLQDQTGATNSMYGLGSSAAGAGVANQALGNFNIDWQNAQLQRQLQGLQGLGQISNIAGQYNQAGAGELAAAPQYTLQGGQLPYQTAQFLGGQPAAIGGQYGQYLQSNVYGPAQSFQNQAIPYMNAGIGAQAVPYQNAYDQANALGGAAYQGISRLGNNPQVQAGLGGLFGGGSSGGGYGGQSALGFGDVSASPYYSGGGNTYGFTM
jgi:hypothetical protein